MNHQVAQIEDAIIKFRQMLPKATATAMAIDGHEPWDGIARKAVDDGYIENAEDFEKFVEVCTRSRV
jgi:hypothetical protein